MTNAVTKIETAARPVSKAAVEITATWDGVRHWLNAAKLFEQGKLFSQVMTGFELLALKKATGIQHGGDRSSSHDGNLKDDWETILQKESGLTQSTAYRYMDMAKAAAPRLKKLPALKNFDPSTTAIAQLGKITRSELETAVKKITDGKTQQEFGEQLGLWKKKQSAPGTTPASGEKKKLTLSEEASARQEQARLDWNGIAMTFTAYTDKFLLLTDFEVEAQIAVLELQLTARKAWLKQPGNKRDPKAIAEMFRQVAGATGGGK
jgi:hypothetical protein